MTERTIETWALWRDTDGLCHPTTLVVIVDGAGLREPSGDYITRDGSTELRGWAWEGAADVWGREGCGQWLVPKGALDLG